MVSLVMQSLQSTPMAHEIEEYHWAANVHYNLPKGSQAKAKGMGP